MSQITYPRERTALLLVDPYNDFLSEGGMVFPRIKPVADEVGLLDNLRQLDGAVRAAGIQVVRAIGVKKLIPILAVGGLALGLMMSRSAAATNASEAPAE